jgi:hypothetical protein
MAIDPKGATRAAVQGIAQQAREGLSASAAGWRRTGRHQRMRMGIVAAWSAVSLLALWVTCSTGGPSNSLGADVQVLRDSLVGGQQLLVRNESSSIWTDVVLTLDGEWLHEQRTMRPHDQIVLSPSNFRRGTEAPPRDYKPRSLSVRCDQGRASFELR